MSRPTRVWRLLSPSSKGPGDFGGCRRSRGSLVSLSHIRRTIRMVTIMNRGTGALVRLRSNPTAAVLSMLVFPALTGNASCQAQEKATVLPETQAGREIMVELQEIGPVESERQIRTTNLDFLFRIKRFDSPDFKF